MLTRSSPLGQMTSDIEVIITLSYRNSAAHIRILRDLWNDPITIQATEKPNLSLSLSLLPNAMIGQIAIHQSVDILTILALARHTYCDFQF